MAGTDLLRMFFSMLLANLPTLIVCVVGLVVVLVNWKRAPRAAIWALLAFALALVIYLGMPALHTVLQRWVFQGSDQASRVWVFTAVGLVWSTLHGCCYVLLLVGVFTDRAKG